MRTNKAFWIALLAFFCIGRALSQPPDMLWTYVYDSPSPDMPFAISQTMDGGFAIGSNTGFTQRGLLIRLDSEGEELWTWGYRDSLFVLFASIATRDGGFAVAGQQGPSRTLVIKTDGAGAVEWSDSLPAPSWAGTALVETPDSGLVVLAVGGGLRLLRYSSEGDTVWTRTVVQSLEVGPASMVITADHGFFLAGSLNRQVYVVKTDSLGFEEWSLVFGNRQLREEICSASVTADGDYLVAGWQGDEWEQWRYPFLGLVARTGDTIWTRVYDELGPYGFHSVCALPEGDWVVGGRSDSGWVVSRCNPDGNIVWSATYAGLLPTYYGATMCLTTDGGLAMAGYRLGLEFTEDIYVVRTASMLRASPSPHVSTLSFTLLPNYPNPFNSTTYLEFTLPSTQRVSLRLYDILGREVAVLMNEIRIAGRHEMMFDASGLPSGVYLCRLEAGGMAQTRKIVLIK